MPKLSQLEFAKLVQSMPDASDEEILAAAKARETGEAPEQESLLGKVWRKANEPLTSVGEKVGKAYGDFVDNPSTTLKEIDAFGEPLAKLGAQARGFAAGAAEGAGKLFDNLTSPLNLALTATGIGGEVAGAKGSLGISRAARGAEAALQAPLVAEGANNIYQGAKEGDISKVGSGALEGAMGAVGMKNSIQHSFPVQKVAEAYNKSAGLPVERAAQHEPVSVNQEFAKGTADAYEAMPHTPEDPQTVAAYKQLSNEIENQFAFITQKAGVKMEPWTSAGQPYASSADMMADIKNNNRLFYFPTEGGYGQGAEAVQHPMLNVSERFGVPVNDLFRAVHDYFGHAKQGFQFGPKGEENAYLSHRGTLSDEAIPALTTETRGQNSYVNFGRHLRQADGAIPSKGQPGYVPPAERPFAEQKAGLLPEEYRQAVPQSAPAADAAPPQATGVASAVSSAISPNSASRGIGNVAAASKPAYDLGSAAVNVGELTAKEGGATFNLYKGSLSGTDHYAVSVYPERGVVVDGQATPQQISQFVQQNQDLLKDPNNSIGTWFNKEDGKTYLDISVTTPNLDDALKLAQEKKQLAIFDLKNFQEIKTPAAGQTGAAPAVQQMAGAPAEFHAVEPQTAPAKAGGLGGSTALAIAAPAASMAIPDDPDSKWDDYGRIGLGIAGLAGVGMAAARTSPLTGEKLFAAKGAGYMLAGVPQKAWADRMIQQGVPEELLPKIHAASSKMLEKETQKLGKQMTSAKKLVSYFKTGSGDLSWYDDTHKELQVLFGKDADMVAGFLTATSINSTVKSNTSLAMKAYKQWKAGEEFTGFLPAVIKELDRVKNGQPLAGRKLDNFRRALTGDPDAVVVDRWMLRAFGYPNVGNGSENAASVRAYDLIENAIKELASQQGVAPRQMQAAIWFAVKNKAEEGMGRPASPPYQTAIREHIDKRHEEALKENKKFDKSRSAQQLPF